MDSRLRGNDSVDLCGNGLAGVGVGVCDTGVEFNLPQPEHFTNKLGTKSTDGWNIRVGLRCGDTLLPAFKSTQ